MEYSTQRAQKLKRGIANSKIEKVLQLEILESKIKANGKIVKKMERKCKCLPAQIQILADDAAKNENE